MMADAGLDKLVVCIGGFTHIRRQVFPQAPSPTMTSLRRISAMISRAAVTVLKEVSSVVESLEAGNPIK